MRYETPKATSGCAFPKPRRKKRSSGDAWRQAKITKNKDGTVTILPRHNDVLFACIERVELAGLKYEHVPDTLYQTFGIYNPIKPNGLSGVLDKALGYQIALRIKKEWADEFKGKPDLKVFASLGNGMNLDLQGDVKIGRDKFNHAQKEWAKCCSVREWHSVEDFQRDFDVFLKTVRMLEKLINFNEQEPVGKYNKTCYINKYESNNKSERGCGDDTTRACETTKSVTGACVNDRDGDKKSVRHYGQATKKNISRDKVGREKKYPDRKDKKDGSGGRGKVTRVCKGSDVPEES